MQLKSIYEEGDLYISSGNMHVHKMESLSMFFYILFVSVSAFILFTFYVTCVLVLAFFR